jgi:hypothetical protein
VVSKNQNFTLNKNTTHYLSWSGPGFFLSSFVTDFVRFKGFSDRFEKKLANLDEVSLPPSSGVSGAELLLLSRSVLLHALS